MKSSKILSFVLAVLFSASAIFSQASGAGPVADGHPAVVIGLNYVDEVSKGRYEAAAEKVKPKHLDAQVKKYARAVRNTPSVDAEDAMLRRLGVKRLREIEAMDGPAFYVAHQRALERERRITPTTRKRIEESFHFKLLGAVEENDDLVHILVRTSHETLNAIISELLIVSIESVAGNWLIAPEHQEMKVRPLITGELPAEMDAAE